jgi:cytochrome c peroxidase
VPIPFISDYFPLGFPGQTDLYTLANVTKAIAAFERTIISLKIAL